MQQMSGSHPCKPRRQRSCGSTPNIRTTAENRQAWGTALHGQVPQLEPPAPGRTLHAWPRRLCRRSETLDSLPVPLLQAASGTKPFGFGTAQSCWRSRAAAPWAQTAWRCFPACHLPPPWRSWKSCKPPRSEWEECGLQRGLQVSAWQPEKAHCNAGSPIRRPHSWLHLASPVQGAGTQQRAAGHSDSEKFAAERALQKKWPARSLTCAPQSRKQIASAQAMFAAGLGRRPSHAPCCPCLALFGQETNVTAHAFPNLWQ